MEIVVQPNSHVGKELETRQVVSMARWAESPVRRTKAVGEEQAIPSELEVTLEHYRATMVDRENTAGVEVVRIVAPPLMAAGEAELIRRAVRTVDSSLKRTKPFTQPGTSLAMLNWHQSLVAQGAAVEMSTMTRLPALEAAAVVVVHMPSTACQEV
jgi:hypothetical protein